MARRLYGWADRHRHIPLARQDTRETLRQCCGGSPVAETSLVRAAMSASFLRQARRTLSAPMCCRRGVAMRRSVATRCNTNGLSRRRDHGRLIVVVPLDPPHA
jgi:hypothetical protein